MQRTARLFNCARCRQQQLICRMCDRGQRYCGPGCARAARSAARRAAGARYQHSRRGRFTHAARQSRYRARQQKVTHQGSLVPDVDVSLPVSALPGALLAASPPPPPLTIVCQACNGRCSPYLRSGFLRRGTETLRVLIPHPRRAPSRPSG